MKRVNAWVLTDAQLAEVAMFVQAAYDRSFGRVTMSPKIAGTISLLVEREKRRRAGRKKRGN